MPDRENVISKIKTICEICKENKWITKFTSDVIYPILSDALALLKEQQQRIEQLEIDIDILVKDINTNNCNTCKRECEYRPIPGDVVRVNCFMWEGR